MAMRAPAGFISAFFDPLKNPDAPTSPSASAGDASASVSFTAPANVGGSAITAYYAVANTGATGTAASSPVTVSGLTNGTSYTFNVWALNSYGPGPWSTATNSVTPAAAFGLFGGGSGPLSSIDYFNMSSTGNATFFGNLTQARMATSTFGSTTRSVWASGGVSGTATNTIDYVTPTSTGNAISFGQLNFTSNDSNGGGCNSSTRGLAGGGYPGTASTSIDYVTIASTGNATAFGTLSVTSVKFVGCCSSPTRGVWVGGANSGGTAQSVMQYVTIATTGNTTSFGFLTLFHIQEIP